MEGIQSLLFAEHGRKMTHHLGIRIHLKVRLEVAVCPRPKNDRTHLGKGRTFYCSTVKEGRLRPGSVAQRAEPLDSGFGAQTKAQLRLRKRLDQGRPRF